VDLPRRKTNSGLATRCHITAAASQSAGGWPSAGRNPSGRTGPPRLRRQRRAKHSPARPM